MILCVCPNPSIDAYAWVDGHATGKLTRIVKLREYPGGKAVHVAMALRELGVKTAILGNWAGPNGDWIRKECKKKRIVSKGIDLEGNNRKCYTFRSQDPALNDSELLEPGPTMTTDDWNRFLPTFEKQAARFDLVCISGSWPTGAPDDANLQLVQICKKLRKKVILDCSGVQLRNVLKTDFFGLHINEQEAISIFDTASTDEIFSKLRDKISLVALTRGKSGLYLNYRDRTLHGNVAVNKVISSVGSGDCLTAGILLAISKKLPVVEIVKYGVACGAANCLTEDLGMLKCNDVNELLPKVGIKEW